MTGWLACWFVRHNPNPNCLSLRLAVCLLFLATVAQSLNNTFCTITLEPGRARQNKVRVGCDCLISSDSSPQWTVQRLRRGIHPTHNAGRALTVANRCRRPNQALRLGAPLQSQSQDVSQGSDRLSVTFGAQIQLNEGCNSSSSMARLEPRAINYIRG